MPFTVTTEIRRQYKAKYLAKPDTALKVRSRAICAWAIKSGKLERLPCEECGDPRSQAHHEDYSKPIDVRWLCQKCHGVVHRKSHCRHGHPFTDKNSLMAKHGRLCRACRAERDRAVARAERRKTSEGLETSVFLGNAEDLVLCPDGHAMFGPNVQMRKFGGGRRGIVCRECARAGRLKWQRTPQGQASLRACAQRYKLSRKGN